MKYYQGSNLLHFSWTIHPTISCFEQYWNLTLQQKLQIPRRTSWWNRAWKWTLLKKERNVFILHPMKCIYRCLQWILCLLKIILVDLTMCSDRKKWPVIITEIFSVSDSLFWIQRKKNWCHLRLRVRKMCLLLRNLVWLPFAPDITAPQKLKLLN